MRNERRMEVMQSVLHFSATAIGRDSSGSGDGCGGGGSSNSLSRSSSISSSSRSSSSISSSSNSSNSSSNSQNLYFVVYQQQKNIINAKLIINDINMCIDLQRPWLSHFQRPEGTNHLHVPGPSVLFFMEKIRS